MNNQKECVKQNEKIFKKELVKINKQKNKLNEYFMIFKFYLKNVTNKFKSKIKERDETRLEFQKKTNIKNTIVEILSRKKEVHVQVFYYIGKCF